MPWNTDDTWDINHHGDAVRIKNWKPDEIRRRLDHEFGYQLTWETVIYLMAKLAKAGQLAPPEPKEE